MNMNVTIPADGELWFGNSRVAIRVATADGADGVCVIEHWLPHGEAPPLHVHLTEDEVFHVLEGTMRFVVGGVERIAGPGETVLAPKGVPHAFRVVSPAGARCLTVTANGDFERMIRAASRPATAPGLPPQAPLTPTAIALLSKHCADNEITILGEPLAA